MCAKKSSDLLGGRPSACKHGDTRCKLLRCLPQVRLPFKDLPNGAIEVEDEEGGDYCVPARAPGTPPPYAAANSSS